MQDDGFKPTWDDDIDIGDIGGSDDEDDVELHLPYEPVASTSALPDGDDLELQPDLDPTG